MKPLNERDLSDREIKDLLVPSSRPAPPADLADRIKQEIPEDIFVAPGPTVDATTVTMPRSRVWLLAASVIVAVGGAFFALRVMEQMPSPGAQSIQADAEAPDGRPPSAGRPTGAETEGPRSAPASSAEVAPEDPAARLAGESAPEADRDDAFANRMQLNEDALRRPREEQRQRALGELEEQKRVEPRPRQDAPAAVLPPPASAPAPAPPPPAPALVAERRPELPAERTETVIVVGEAQLFDAPSAQDRVLQEPEPEGLEVTAERPPAGAREKKAAATEIVGGGPEKPAAPRAKRRPVADPVPGNASIEQTNAMIAPMRTEARKLEEELRALEPSQRPAAVAPPSTGGTAEPNDAPYGDVFFEGAGTNPFIDTEDDALSTFGLDVDTGSYTVARRYLRDGHLPPPEAVRVEEFINYFDYGDAPPEEAEFAIHAEGSPSIYGEGESGSYYLLRFNLSGRELAARDRRPALLTFVVDVSGSMARENRLGLVQQALALLIDQLRADDRLALVIYGSRGQVVLEPTGDHGAIRRAIQRLQTGGSTNAEEGLELAYQLAVRHRRRGAINRVILCSDGVANVGRTSADSILERIRREADQGIELTTVGFGMGNYNDVLMERLADTGNGRYAYVDTLDEARRIFVENLTGTLQTLAAEARVQVEFDSSRVSRYRLLGYENRDIADHRFRDPTVDAGEIGVGHKVTALYEIKLAGKLRDSDRIGTLRLRYGSIDTGKTIELERAVTGADFARRWQDASPALRLTSLVAEYAEILKRSYWAREGDLDDVFRRAQRLSAQFEGDREVADFVSLVGRAAGFREREDR